MKQIAASQATHAMDYIIGPADPTIKCGLILAGKVLERIKLRKPKKRLRGYCRIDGKVIYFTRYYTDVNHNI